MSFRCSHRQVVCIAVLILVHSSPTSSKDVQDDNKTLCHGRPPWYQKSGNPKSVGCWFDAPSKYAFPYICEKDMLALSEDMFTLKLHGGVHGQHDQLCGTDGWLALDSMCYKVFREPLNFLEAEKKCGEVAKGGHLAMPSSNKENWLVARLCSADLLDGCLIGVQSIPSSTNDSSIWAWVNGTELSYTSWFIGQPQVVGWQKGPEAGGDEVALINWHHWDQVGGPTPIQKALQGAVGLMMLVVTITTAIVLCCLTSPTQAPSHARYRRLEVDTNPVTGLRALSALMIATGHCFTFNIASNMDFDGGFAVTIFMFISGVVMVVAFVDKCNDAKFDYNFIVRRLVRLFPMHWLGLALSYPVLFTHIPPSPDFIGAVVVSVPTTFVLVQSWWMPALLLGGNGVAWTMSTFLYFYAACPHLLRRLDRQYRKQDPSVCVLLCVSLLSMACPPVFYVLAKGLGYDDFTAYMACRAHPFARMPLFYLGMLTGLKCVGPPQEIEYELHESASFGSMTTLAGDPDASREQLLGDVRSVAKPARRCTSDLLSLLMLVWCIGTTVGETLHPEQALAFRSLVEFGCAPLLPFWLHSLLRSKTGCMRAFLSLKIVRTVGEWSFCIYLLQLPLWDITRSLILGSVDNRFPVYMVPVLLAEVIFFAALCHRLVEEPCRRRLAKCLQREKNVNIEQSAELTQLMHSPQAEAAQEAYIFTCGSCGTMNQVFLVARAPLPTSCMCYQCGNTTSPNALERVG